MGGWMDGWVDGWMDGKAGLRIAYSNQKMLRVLERKRINDRMPVKKMHTNQNVLSVNQLAAQIKLVEVG